MNHPLVSIIIPVYNVEKYLKKCLDSVISQSYDNLEIILVDDGSTDSSGQICDHYKEKEERILVIHKSNGGQAEARNYGMDICKGDYIAFIDSDDFISPYFIEILIKNALNHHCEVVALAMGIEFWNHEDAFVSLASSSNDYTMIKMTASDAVSKMFYQKIAIGAPFKLYKRNIISNIRFPVGYIYEDAATTYKFLLKTKDIIVVKSALYAYRKHANSTVRKVYDNKKISAIEITRDIIKNLKNNPIVHKELIKAAHARAFSLLFSVFLQIPKSNISARDLFWKEIKKYRWSVLCNHSTDLRKKDRVAAIISYFGMSLSYLLGKRFGQRGTMHP